MKKMIQLIIALLLVYLTGHAQISFDFGSISQEEIKIKECSFDPDANAIVLLHDAVSTYDDDYELITDYHVRIKILKEKGIELADVSIPYYTQGGFEEIVNIEAVVINFDENGQRREQALDRKSIFTKPTNKFISEKKFTFPAIKVGSIIEYRYRSVMKHYGGLEDWHFQQELPVIESKYVLTIPPRLQFTYQVYKSQSYEVDVKSDIDNAKVTFGMKNVPGLRTEPYMDSRRDYLQRVTFQLSGFVSNGYTNKNYMSSWDQVKKELLANSDFGGQLGKTLDRTDDFIKVTKQLPSDLEKMKLVYDYVRSNMTWNRFNSKFSPDGIKSAWNKKTGTNGDINLILVNLLRSVGLDASPMLVSERQHGKVNTSYPFVDQFNTTYAYVAIGDKKYFLDATDGYTPVEVTPSAILNTTAFIVNRKAGGLVNISDDVTQYKSLVNVSAKVSADGSVKGEVLVTNDGYARIERVAEYKANHEKYVANNYHQSEVGISISDFAVSNEDIDSLPLRNTFNFYIPANANGDYVILPYNLFSGYETNPFISNNRFSNINFGWKQTTGLNTHIQIPEELKVDALPKSIKMVNSDNSITFTRQVFPDDGSKTVVIRTRIEFTKTEYPPEEYPNLKEFYKKLFELLNEQIVLKKK